MSRSLPLPEGTYTLLPLIDACDNFVLPHGPWSAKDLKARWSAHEHSKPLPTPNTAAKQNESALDSDDDEPAATSDDRDDEFLAPFFVSLPPSSLFPSGPTSHSRRPSTTRAQPTLRPSSPTPAAAPAATATPTSASPPPAPQPIGFLRPEIIRALIADNVKMAAMACQPVWKFLPPIETPLPPPTPTRSRRSSSSTGRRPSLGMSALPSSNGDGASSGSRRDSSGAGTAVGMSMTPLGPGTEGATGSKGAFKLAEALKSLGTTGPADGSGTWAAGFEDWVIEEGSETMREHADRVARGWHMDGRFSDQLGGWRNEEYAIYGPHPAFDKNAEPKLPGGNFVFSMERAACALFGVATYGVHCTAYIEEPDEPLKIWVPRRSATKPTWPSYLDNTVAGGITSQASPLSSIIRECAEEASLDPSITEPALRSVSVLSYTYRTPTGWVQPEVQYIYDLKLDRNVICTTNEADGEVESFSLMAVDEVVERMCRGEFKPNCAMVLIDFFQRHGFLTPESDARFLEIATRLRRPLVLPGPI
ncbi:hypothetical protein RQP46_007058 [Phenoliferia psychrophenolica]